MIKDSGNRTAFHTGAVRDIQEGKGRCDLLPMDIVDEFILKAEKAPAIEGESVWMCFDEFVRTGDYTALINAAVHFVMGEGALEGCKYTALLEYAIHLEEGAQKYGDRNWQKGIPLRNYISSAVRHYMRYERGDDDERHDRAFFWNCLCGAWTAKHMPDLNEYVRKE